MEAMVAIFNEINKRQSVLGSVCVCESVCVSEIVRIPWK